MQIKRIGIDARLYFQTGVGTYLRNFLHYLPRYAPHDVEFYIYVMPHDTELMSFEDKRFLIRPVDAPWHSLSEQTTYYRVLMEDKLDLMHFTYFSYPVFYKRPYLATVHDLTPLLFKTGRASTLNPIFYEFKYQIFKKVLSSQVRNAQKLITPSQSVRNQLLEVFGSEHASKTVSIHEGVNYELLEANERASLAKKLPSSYFLYVGNFYPHKNVDRLIDAYKEASVTEHLVMTGPDNAFSQKLKKKVKPEYSERIHFIHNTTNEDLVYLYKHAKALVNPSLSEGFGLPLVEAAYFGCPVIASDIPVFKEILGENYVAFDPKNIEDMANKFQSRTYSVASNIDAKFSFERMTEATVHLYLKMFKQ